MGNLSIVRRVDSLGRIVIPLELRRMLDLEAGQEVEMRLDGERLLLCRHSPGCIFCNGSDKLVAYQEKYVCFRCRQALSAEM